MSFLQLSQAVMLKPKETFSKTLKKGDFQAGVRYAFISLVVLLVVNALFTALGGLIEGKEIAGGLILSVIGSVNSLIITLVALAVFGYLAGLLAVKLFKGKGNPTKTAGLTMYSAAVILAVGALLSVVGFLFTLLGNLYLASLATIAFVLWLISLPWVLFVSVQAVMVSNGVKMGPAVVCSLISVVIALLVAVVVNVPLAMILGGLGKAVGLP